ncbi:hypothetical protein ONR75_27340 [Rhodopseudomonas sp. P2A-2r]|uniref:hypothetical protein n=1 Tax=Rhodopseudomonas sp. P2A-2r TaxID=2991972 RepID=UPI002234186F|nr:hypothetical protein [Rhodopseudomonas sp. P2A-2r]UZE48471.1 hypothetical protein ONR75_27340 [Rhodopseudomonas sp. P2A-2r]
MTAKRNTAQKIPADIALVVFGTDRAKKHRASRFGLDAVKPAQEAAKAMGMRALCIVSDEQREIARKLPKGTVSPKGRTVVPLVRPALYNQLLAVAGTEGAPATPPSQPANDAGKQPASAAAAKSETSGGWNGLMRSSVVLATENIEEGWFAAEVQHVDGDVLTLRWQSWPDLPKFNRKLTQVALLHPKMVKAC